MHVRAFSSKQQRRVTIYGNRLNEKDGGVYLNSVFETTCGCNIEPVITLHHNTPGETRK